MSASPDVVRVLLVDDDEEDYLLTRDLLAGLEGARHEIEWAADYNSALAAVAAEEYDICFVDYRLGPDDGIELIRELVAGGFDVPAILLTGQGDRAVDVEASAAGASDYLVKGEINPALLERTIRYAVRSHADMQALREKEEGLRQAQKMEAIGNLAGGIAHDFNNLLLVIRGYTAILLKKLTDDDLRANAEQIESAAQRAGDFTHQLLAFSRQQVLRPEVTDLNAVVEDTIKLLNRSLGDDIELDCDLQPDLPTITIDQGQLAQVILNLAVNAREAMSAGGRLVLKTAAVELDELYAHRRGVAPGRHVLLQITDSGPGMDQETQSRVFDPYFTTKDDGTGLGLATVHGIVNQSGGHIWLYSEPGMGTTFKIYFPNSGKTATAAPPVEDVGSLEGTETILLVEDTDLIRTLVAQILAPYGYTVLTASNGADALILAREHVGSIDLLLTDVVMAGMNGRELSERLAQIDPNVRVLFSSGYPADTVIRHGIAEGTMPFIEKPYLPDDLARKVRETLDRGPAA